VIASASARATRPGFAPPAFRRGCLDSLTRDVVMIGERLRSLLAGDKTFKFFPELGDDVSLFESGVIDSFGMIALVIQIELEFGIKVRPEEATAQNFRSISSIARFVEAKVDGYHRG
jgi:acyl carrier protein